MTRTHRSGPEGRPSAGLRGWGFVGFGVAVIVTGFLGLPSVTAAQQVPAAIQFRPITVDEAVEIARRRNPTLLQAFTSIEQAEHTRLSAYGSFLPSVNMSFGYSNSSSGRLDVTGQGIVQTSYSTQLTATYNLFDGWSRFIDLKGAKLGVVEQNARYRQVEFQTIRLAATA